MPMKKPADRISRVMLPSLYLAAIAMATVVLSNLAARAQTTTPPVETAAPARELVIGTKEAAPFSMKAADGTWQGISIDLWRRVADENHLSYRIAEEATVQDLLDGVISRKFDIAVAALTPTAARARIIDFTQPFYASGLGIAVPVEGVAGWFPVFRAMTSFGFLRAVLALVGLALAAGCLIWLFERRRNESFSGGVAKGLSSGILWSASTMTQRHAGSFQPQTLPGRIVAVFWMVTSIIAIAVFTAGITSALTTRQLRGAVHSTSDLSSVRVGAVQGTSGQETLDRLRIGHRNFATLPDGVKALRTGRIDALVHDKPLLAWVIREDPSSSIELVDATIAPQNYAFAIPLQSPFRRKLDTAILDATNSAWWDRILFQYFGSKP